MINHGLSFWIGLFVLILFAPGCQASGPADGDWPAYWHDPYGTRYSPLNQIRPDNVSRLERAWTYHTGDLAGGNHVMECTPLVVDGTVFIITTFSRVAALDGVTGEKLWDFDPKMDYRREGMLASRGLAYWTDVREQRIILPAHDGRLFSLNALDGQPDPHFGENGVVNLRERLAPGGRSLFISSPPAVYRDMLIQGCGMPDGYGERLQHVPVIALNVRTGESVWTFNTIPQDGGPGSETWAGDSWRDRGAGNVWSGIRVDPERGIVFLPATSPTFDFYGGDRQGNNWFCDSLVALRAETGERLWHFQAVHHDLWDYDLPAQPNLLYLMIGGRRVPAVAQVGKTAFVYVLNRETGEPIFPIEERAVPTSDVPGEMASPTQPFPQKPPPISRQGITEADLSRLDEETHQYVLQEFRKYRSGAMYTPPSMRGTVYLPAFHGGANWSGAAVTPEGMMYVNTTELPGIITLEKDNDSPYGYRHTGWIRFRDQNGYPAIAPPWGQLVKLDLNRGEKVWEKPLGEFDELTQKGIPPTGQENFGGPLATGGGLVFIASTKDECFRAFDAQTGDILFKIRMEAGGYAAPVSYLGKNGKQYVVICAGGGGKLETKPGDYVIGFALP